MRISAALAMYEQQLSADGRSHHTRKQARRHIRLLIETIGDGEIAKVRHEDIAQFLASDAVRKRADGGPRKATSANALRSSLRAFFSFAHAAAYTSINPARLVRRARCAPPRPRGLTPAEVTRLIAALDTATTTAELRDRAMFRTALGLGLRVGSLVALDVGDLDLEAASVRLRVMKNADADVVYLSAELVTLLRTYLGDRRSGPLFPRTNGERIGVRQVARRLETWAERAAIERKISPHTLRHAFALAMYERSGDVLLVSRLLCHRSLASTATYARPSEARARAAVGT